jgi:hypothetical protein
MITIITFFVVLTCILLLLAFPLYALFIIASLAVLVFYAISIHNHPKPYGPALQLSLQAIPGFIFCEISWDGADVRKAD